MNDRGAIMRHTTVATLILFSAVLLTQGCQRRAPNETPKASSTGENPQSEIRNPKSENDALVLISGGRFTMGDKDEPDATLHEVMVSSFYMDKFLVTQEQYEKIMGDNPSRWKG